MKRLIKLPIIVMLAFIGSVFTSCGGEEGGVATQDALTHINRSDSASAGETKIYGADVNPTGQPIGGGEGYTGGIKRSDSKVKHNVSTAEELLKALSMAQAGDIIWLEGDAEIDMTRRSVMIKGGVTLASDRGENGSLGGRIYQTAASSRLFTVNGENVRITGLRIEGPHKETSPVNATAVALYCRYPNLEIDNCEFFGWSDAAIGVAGSVSISGGGASAKNEKEETGKKPNGNKNGDTDAGISDLEMKAGAYIHHNYIHHNQVEGLGYGIVLSSGGVALIEANYFDYCRHAIAGTGSPGEGYEARYNICGPNWISTSPHNFDMHGFKTGDTIIAGDTIRIYNNTFMGETDEMPTCIAIRGVPSNGAYIYKNWFYFSTDAPVWQTGGVEKVYVENNLIGVDKTLVETGPIRYY